MSTSSIPLSVRLALVGRAGGRCQYPGCNLRLDRDFLTSRNATMGVFAHIVGDKPDGPRGDTTRSSELAKSIDNLMLLCLNHHKLVDVDAVAEHPEALLLTFKRQHEERVANLLDIQNDHRTRLLFLKARIGDLVVVPSSDDARQAVLPQYPDPKSEAVIDLTQLSVRDDDPEYWRMYKREIEHRLRDVFSPTLESAGPTSLAVFALAPIPLLMLLGRCLGDIVSVRVFQKHRVPDTWSWGDRAADTADVFTLTPPENPAVTSDVALALSVSGIIHPEEIAASPAGAIPLWRIEASRPGVSFVLAEAQVQQFATLYRHTMQEIRRLHGASVRIHLYGALPNSLAIECGRRLLPKVDPSVRVYDRSRARAWAFALDLLEVPPSTDKQGEPTEPST